jgi:hypothetical protein
MYKPWRIALSTAHLLVVFAAFVWFGLERSVDISGEYAYTTRDIAIKLNFPVFAIWGPIAHLIDRFDPQPAPSSAVVRTIVVIVVIGIPAASIALFWYFFVVEVELRLKNESLIRFRNWLAETCKALILFAIGTGALIYAALEMHRLFQLSKADAFIGGALLLAWGTLFITTSVRDTASFLRERHHVAQ